MLADRFDFEFHRETRQVKGFELVVAKGGAKLKATSGDYESPRVLFDESFRRVIKGASRLNELADVLLPARQPVVDKTGLAGAYTYEVFAPLPPPPPPTPPGAQATGRSGPGGPGELQPASDTAAALSASLESTIGLRLQAATVSVEMLVIDSVARPSAN
jgi:uncharacterized protein (TIGR03435 family)